MRLHTRRKAGDASVENLSYFPCPFAVIIVYILGKHIYTVVFPLAANEVPDGNLSDPFLGLGLEFGVFSCIAIILDPPDSVLL
jgi:hypothetical protein